MRVDGSKHGCGDVVVVDGSDEMKWYVVFGLLVIVVAIISMLGGCGGGEDDKAPTVAEEAPKYHVPTTPDPCTTTYPCQAK